MPITEYSLGLSSAQFKVVVRVAASCTRDSTGVLWMAYHVLMTTETGEVAPNEMGAKAHQPGKGTSSEHSKRPVIKRNRNKKFNASLGICYLACIKVNVGIGCMLM
jgi:hypothetical protein